MHRPKFYVKVLGLDYGNIYCHLLSVWQVGVYDANDGRKKVEKITETPTYLVISANFIMEADVTVKK